ncbi:hypothetical protein [Bacillus sp. 1P06AnD]|uniref:hypothetical protein n=1 Tax=Bacillus sp. 1P06AnD TaxID=3132208 RepID=UPI0039A3C363
MIRDVKMKKRLCPCGSKKQFEECCYTPISGETAENLKRDIYDIVKLTFRGQPRGELCLYVSLVVKYLLSMHDIRSYVVAGSSRWIGYPTFFEYKQQGERREFHAWVVTQYGETVDLACDAIEERSDYDTLTGPKLGISPPIACWDKVLTDRVYTPNDKGVKSFDIDKSGLNVLIDRANKIIENLYLK